MSPTAPSKTLPFPSSSLDQDSIGSFVSQATSSSIHDAGEVQPGVPRVVIIDGLDEYADDQTQVHLLETFAELLSEHFVPVCLRFMVASRPEKHLRDAFYAEPLKPATIHLNIGESVNFSETTSRYCSRGKLGAQLVTDPLPCPMPPTIYASVYTHFSVFTIGAPLSTPEVQPSTPLTSESSYSPFSINMDLPSTSSVQSSTPDSIFTVTGDTTPSWSSIWRSHSYRTSQTSFDSTKSLPLGEYPTMTSPPTIYTP